MRGVGRVLKSSSAPQVTPPRRKKQGCCGAASRRLANPQNGPSASRGGRIAYHRSCPPLPPWMHGSAVRRGRSVDRVEDHTRRGVRDFNLQAWTLGERNFRAWVYMFGTFFASRHVHVCVCVCALVCWALSPWGAHSAMKYPTHALRMPSRLAAPGQASASCSSSAFCSSETHLDGVTVGFG